MVTFAFSHADDLDRTILNGLAAGVKAKVVFNKGLPRRCDLIRLPGELR